MTARDAGILGLLRENRDFRRLWLGQVVSQGGDWFNHVAIATLLLELTGSGALVGWALVLRMLTVFVVAPFAGVVVDRVDRRRVMIACDVLRALVVPAYLFVDRPERVPLVFVLIVLQVTPQAFFDPARSALMPNLVSRGHLISANVVSSLTWSLMVSVGSLAGGLVIARFGLAAAFLIDAATFVGSAVFLAGIRVPPRVARAPVEARRAVAQGWIDLRDGLVWLARRPAILSLSLVKCGVALASGMVLLLNVFGERVFPIGGDAALGIGVLFGVRGVGTALGPFVGRALARYHEPAMRRLIGFGFLESALFFVLFAFAPNLWVAMVLLLFAHLGTSVNWVFSTVLLQMKVEDAFRGRVFAAELALFTAVFCIANALTGHALDDLGVDPRTLAAISGAVLVVPAVLWMSWNRGSRRNPAPDVLRSRPSAPQ